MTPRRIRQGMIAVAVVTAGFAPLVLLWGGVAPYDAGAPAPPAPAASAKPAAVRPAGHGGGVPALAEFDTLWDVDLRRPLVDPAPAVPSALVVRAPAGG